SALSFDFDFAFNYKGYLSGLPALFSIPLHIDIFVDFDGALGNTNRDKSVQNMSKNWFASHMY
ncbi:MAG: hypothetical protein M0Q40_12290, partial [Limnochordia bacterium]|nr:hypothetical protein [Limnochordia bacterium]